MSGRTVRASRAVVAIALATAVAAPAFAAADYFLKIEDIKGESADRSPHKGEIEVLSFSWGATQPSHSAGGGSGGMGAGKVNVQDISMMRGPRQTAATDGAQGATGDVDGDAAKFGAVSGAHRDDSVDSAAAHTVKSPRDAASGQATGKRTHNPMTIEKPLEKGSIILKMALPGCAVGTHYPAAEVGTPDARYALSDVEVVGCDGEVTLNYAKVIVRGWDPKKKVD